MSKSRSRSPNPDHGRWGDHDDNNQSNKASERWHVERPRSLSRDREERRRRNRTRPSSHSRSPSRSRSHSGGREGRRGAASYGRDDGRDQDWERDCGRDRLRDRDRDRDQERRRDRDRRREADRGRDRSRSRSRGHGHRRWGSPRRGGAEGVDGRGAAGAATGGIGGGGGGGEEPPPRRRRWRSPSPPAVRPVEVAAGEEGRRGRGGNDTTGGAWNNPPPPPSLHSQGRGPAPPVPLSTAPPPVGSIHRGIIHTIRPFGLFVALPGFRRHVMVHNTQVSDELRFNRDDDDEAKVKALEFYFPKGEQVWVKITEVSPDERNTSEMRVNGSLRVVDQTTGTDLDPEGLLAAEQHQQPGGGGGRGRGGPETDEPPEVGSVHRAVVKRIEAYGVFVALDGYRRHGLVHTSQVSNYLSFTREDTDEQKKAELGGVVTVGEQIWVKVVEVAPDEGRGGFKIGCSIKLVNQASAEDLDPANTRYRPRDAAGRGPGAAAAGAIGSGAGEVGRGGKIDWGHLAADTKLYVNEKAAAQYKLLEEEEAPRPPGPTAGSGPGPGPLPGLGRGGGGGVGLPGLHPPGPMGRGRGMVLPAWMTQGTAAAAGGGGGAGGPPAPGSLPSNQLPPSSKFELVGGRDRDVDPSSLLPDFVGVGGGGGGAGGGGSGAGGGTRISSIEEALAILEAHGGKASKKDIKGKKKKKDKDKKGKKDKKRKKKSSKKSAAGERQRSGNGKDGGGSSSSSSSGSDSSSDEDNGSRRYRRKKHG